VIKNIQPMLYTIPEICCAAFNLKFQVFPNMPERLQSLAELNAELGRDE
jgi:hypothetical protein